MWAWREVFTEVFLIHSEIFNFYAFRIKECLKVGENNFQALYFSVCPNYNKYVMWIIKNG